MKIPVPSVNRIRSLLEYCPNTGKLTWKVHRNSQAQKGQEAGYTSNQGYRMVGIDKRYYPAHRVAWLIHYGVWPNNQIDHLNHNRADNRLANLREVSQPQNLKNKSKSKANTSGHTGVYWQNGKWLARICVDRVLINLGVYEELADAVSARKAAEKQYNFHTNHGL